MAGSVTNLAEAPRLDSLTSLRWWAALGVFVFHIRNLVPLPGPVSDLARFGNFGVAFFFVLSGFVLTWSWRRNVGVGTFYWRRFARIYPLHLIALLVALPVFYSFTPNPAHGWVKPVDFAIIVLSFVLLQGWSRDPVIMFSGNPAAWTLTVEAFFYALHPLIMRGVQLLSSRAARLAAGGVLLASVIARIAIVADPTSGFASLPWPVLRVNEFIIGMCLAWAIRTGWRPRIPVWLPVVLLGAYMVGPIVVDRFTNTTVISQALGLFTSEIMVALFALLICASAIADIEGRTRIGRSTILVRLGEWSFAFYLIHATLIYIALGFVGHQRGIVGIVWIVGLLAVSIGCAWALHVVVERPVERGLRTWQNGITQRRQSSRQSAVMSNPTP